MSHIVLLGDSIFDNAAYVGGGPDVIRHLRAMLPAGWRATLCALDGAVSRGIERQLERVPPDATHLIVSVGGNDGLGHAGVLREPARTIADALLRLADVREQFARDYRAMLEAVLGRNLPTALCCVYYPRFPDSVLQRQGVAALSLFNDIITVEAFARGLPVIDLRLVCDEQADYANPIEPSVQGGEKIAAAILRLVREHDFGRRRTEVFIR